MKNRVQAGSLRVADVGQNVTVAGWVRKQRDLGELIFLDLRDRSGILQLVADEARTPSRTLETAKKARSEFVIRATGLVVEREPDRKNSDMATGDIELLVQELEIINRSETVPFIIENETNASEETRLRHRYLDLRRPVLTRNMILRDKVAAETRRVLHESGFLEIETPILTASTPEGARDYLVPSRVHPGELYALPQSPQLFKQLLMVAGLERYYQIAKCFRDEDLRSDRQPEFTQIDIEASFIDEEFVIELIEKLFVRVFPVAGINPVTPFARMSWKEAIDSYGTDRPDLRYPMEIRDVTAEMATTRFPPFQEAIGRSERIRGVVVPRGGGYSRKKLDDLTKAAKDAGASGLVWISFGEARKSSIKKFLDEPDYEKIRNLFGAGSDDLVLLVAGPWEQASTVLGELRTRIAREEGFVPENQWKFVWITDFPLLERDEDADRWVARHHPFTAPHPDDVDKLESAPGEVKARAYDIVLNGLELGGGSIRIHDPELQRKMFGVLGIDEKEAESRFGFLLEALRYGAPPHGGIALGLDRMVMLMAGAQSIRDVMAFPKTTSGQDLMTGAPSAVSAAQLKELSLSFSKKRS